MNCYKDLEVSLGIQNSQLPELNQFLQRQILETVLLRLLDELGRHVLNFGADDVVDGQVEARGLQSLNVLGRDILTRACRRVRWLRVSGPRLEWRAHTPELHPEFASPRHRPRWAPCPDRAVPSDMRESHPESLARSLCLP